MKLKLLFSAFFLSLPLCYGQITFDPNLIDNNQTTANAANTVTAADFDGDGDIDVVGGAFQSDIFSLYRNDGSGTFTQETIDNTNTADGARFVTHFDLDEDGDMDLLATSSTADSYHWYENDGTGSFTYHLIDGSANANEAYGIGAADFDQDGDMDIVGGANAGSKLVIYANDGNENFVVHSDLSGGAFTDGVRAVHVTDLDLDGDSDILVAANSSDTYSWFENDGSANFTPHLIDNSTDANGASQILASDMDNDGDIDVVAGSNLADVVLWFENDGSQGFTKHIIDNATYSDGPRGLALVDLEQDGDMDVLTALITQDLFAWYENDGTGNFTPHLISNDPTYSNGGFAITTGDIDGDMVDDIITAANIADAFSWFKTEGVILSTSSNVLQQIVMYPNPVNELLTIDIPDTFTSVDIRVTDSTGKEIFELTTEVSEKIIIDMHMYASGLYYVSVITSEGIHTKKLVKE